MNKSAGFTLMETLASLTIVCFMTMLPTLLFTAARNIKIEQFLATVEKQLRFAQQQAIVL